MQANAAANTKNKATESGKKWRRRWNSEKLADVGKHRKWADDDVAVLSFKVEGKLIHLLDEETKTMNSEQAPGHAAVSRGELVRIALHEWLAARAKTRVTVVVEKPEPRAEQAMTVVVEQHAPRTEPMTVVVEKPEPRAERSKPRR